MKEQMMKFFAKTWDIPIVVFKEDVFEEKIELYDKMFDSKRKWETFNLEVEQLGGLENFKSIMRGKTGELIEIIKSQPAYKEFSADRIPTIEPSKTLPNNSKKGIYRQGIHNDCKCFLSIDLEKANYNVMKLFNPELVLNTSNFYELMKNAGLTDLMIESKSNRQYLFGNLNPKAQMKLQKIQITNILNELLDMGISENDVYYYSHDEIILDSFNITDIMLNDVLKEIPVPVHVDSISINVMKGTHHNDVFYTRTNLYTGETSFKCVPANYFAQVYKKWNNLPCNENDMLYMYEGKLSCFVDPVFE